MVKYIYLDLNHWINLSRIHIKGEGTDDEIRLYSRLLKAAENEEIVFPLSLILLVEISGTRVDINARKNLAKTVIAFTKNNCIQPLPMTLDWEIKYATIKILSENLVGHDKVRAQTYHDIISNVRDKYPYFPIGKGISVLLGSFPTLKGTKTKEEYDYIMEEVQKFLSNPVTLMNLTISEYTRTLYNKLKETDFKEIIKREKKLTEQRKQVKDKKRRKEFKFIQFLDTSGINETIVRHVLYWSSELGINYYEGLEKTLNFKSESKNEENKRNIINLIQNIPSAWCWFNLEYFRDRHYERKLKITDIYDIYSIANAIPHCDVVLCDNFFSAAVKTTGIGDYFKTNVSHELESLEQEI